MAPPGLDDDDARHRREEDDRRAKRKASKHAKSAEQIEKERKRQKYREDILKQHGQQVSAKTSSSSSNNKIQSQNQQNQQYGTSGTTSGTTVIKGSQFSEQLFGQRTQGFQIEFRFRNAPPRPPVGPCFIGDTIDTLVYDTCRTYKPYNTIEVHHTWKLHTENDIGVPLAPSAMDILNYSTTSTSTNTNNTTLPKLHPDDDALINWTGSLGDTDAELLRRRQEQIRAKERLVSSGRPIPSSLLTSVLSTNTNTNTNTNKLSTATIIPTGMRNNNINNYTNNSRNNINPNTTKNKNNNNKNNTISTTKNFVSRVLKDDKLQTWMKKTTYLSNDHNKRVHDFKSLANTKNELSITLEKQHTIMSSRRSTQSIEQSFIVSSNNTSNKKKDNSTTNNNIILKHPTNSKLKMKHCYSILPDVINWGRAYTHVVIDKAPMTLPTGHNINDCGTLLNNNTFITNVQSNETQEKLSCTIIVPAAHERISILEEAEQKKVTDTKNDDDAMKDSNNNEDDTNDKKEKKDNDTDTDTTKNDSSKNYYEAIQKYDLDVVPLRDDEDVPHTTYAFIINKEDNTVYYIPMASRVSLSTGRPPFTNSSGSAMTTLHTINHRQFTIEEQQLYNERLIDMDIDIGTKYNNSTSNTTGTTEKKKSFIMNNDDDSDGVNSTALPDDDADDSN